MKAALNKHTKGTNQYKPQRANFRGFVYLSLMVLAMIFVVTSRKANNTFLVAHISSTDVYASVPSTPTPTPEPTPSELEEIVAYITRTFEPEGKDVVVEAINCFYSESGLRTDAYNFNSNNTSDHSVAQINSVHIGRFGDGFTKDWKENIDTAYKIYKEQGWNPWYGKLCNEL